MWFFRNKEIHLILLNYRKMVDISNQFQNTLQNPDIAPSSQPGMLDTPAEPMDEYTVSSSNRGNIVIASDENNADVPYNTPVSSQISPTNFEYNQCLQELMDEMHQVFKSFLFYPKKYNYIF